MTPALPDPPTLDAIAATRARLGDRIRTTPVWRWRGPRLEQAIGAGTEVHLKLELWQHTGSFKLRGALTALEALAPEARARGVVAVSAGNHALAVIHAAAVCSTTAKVVMPASANPGRIARCRELGGIVELAPDVHAAFDVARRIERDEGRAFVHPFESEAIVRGTATLGLELCEQVEDLDAVVVPIGGGGLCAGVASAIGQLRPGCAIIGVEPVGADTMHRSFALGAPAAIDRVRTIADSLGAPRAEPYTYGLCRRFVERLVAVDDDALRTAMRLLFHEMKLAVEPAGAATTAALLGPLRESLAGRRVALIVCGANTDLESFHRHVAD